MRIKKSILLIALALLLVGCSSIDEELYDPMVKYQSNETLNTTVL